ncbi:hypothetical protein CC80DRAFT_496411 [Byssothecium circinans]|uniref:RING-type domain-containing protein n=1 Tax=Byssothecium circinans TaxID=147558 RepID=A0A6A5TFA0_9PLEO|nr:hypothetical protein CC80DRAFT_496411 [Byssothecium circinans]
MSNYTNKADFLADGVDASHLPATEMDCPICRESLITAETLTKATTNTTDAIEHEHEHEHEHDGTAPKPDPKSAILIKACSHIFCTGCINEWLQESGTCPMCRKELFTRAPPTSGDFYLMAAEEGEEEDDDDDDESSEDDLDSMDGFEYEYGTETAVLVHGSEVADADAEEQRMSFYLHARRVQELCPVVFEALRLARGEV